MKKLWLILFTLGGSLISSWIAPKWITWFYQSPVSSGVDCTPALEWAMHILIVSQIIGAIIGVILGFIFLKWLESRSKVAR